MNSIYEENPTRQSIIMLLRKSGGMTIDELSRQISITPMGIRQHLLSLEKKGVVTYAAKKHGIGRPGFVYRLTPAADELFPKSYGNFALELLKDIKKYEGEEKVSKIFAWRKDRMFRQKKEALSGAGSIDEAMKRLQNILAEEGHFVELEKENGSYRLKTFNCPISKVADEFKEICGQEIELYRELLNRDVTMEQCIAAGDQACIFKIPSA